MMRIPSLFIREPQGRKFLATPAIDPECQWVADGEGLPTEKIDGTCCAVIDGCLYARHRLREGKVMPAGWTHWSLNPEQMTGHGWVPVGDGLEHQWHREAWEKMGPAVFDGTYELVGPKIQRNPCCLGSHELWEHGALTWVEETKPPRDFEGLKAWLDCNHIEGIVWHHPDGRMCKIKRRDFGIPWPEPPACISGTEPDRG